MLRLISLSVLVYAVVVLAQDPPAFTSLTTDTALSTAIPADLNGPSSSGLLLLPVGVAGGQVTITGRNFGGPYTMSIDGAGLGVVATNTPTTIEFTIPASWVAQGQEFDGAGNLIGPRALLANGVPTGFRVQTVFDCVPEADAIGGLVDRTCRNRRFTDVTGFEDFSILAQQRLQARTTCCKSNNGFGTGMCVNPGQETCCGGVPVGGTETCCNADRQTIARAGERCPCTTGGLDADCPAGESCCVATKFPELAATVTGGSCYNRRFERCCDEGTVYDPEVNQCCSISGITSTDRGCPCGVDADCVGGQRDFPNRHGRCCQQTNPVPQESATRCNKYTNFLAPQPAVDAPQPPSDNRQQASCLGTCVDTRYQICCNGNPCIKEFERCCNATCCNKHVASCTEGIGNRGNGRFNPVEFRVPHYMCTVTEHLTVQRVFWVFLLPTILLLTTLAALAVVLVFANKASSRSYSWVEAAMITLACFAILFFLPTFFSPAYKYGLLAIIACLMCILTAAARIRLLNAYTLVVLFVVLLYMFDPFHGNNYLNFSSYRFSPTGGYGTAAAGRVNRYTAGVLHTIDYMYRNNFGFCVEHFDYFRLDNNLRDTSRFDNIERTTFGLCSRAWIMALLVFTGIALVFLVLLFIMAIIALLLRFRKMQRIAPIELEVQQDGWDYDQTPLMAPVAAPLAPVAAPMVAPMMPMMAGPVMAPGPIIAPPVY